MQLSVGDFLEGRYRIIGRVGEGGMGVVWEAEHVLLKRRCAVKVLHPNEADDQNMIARFKVEARAAANIRHPNIVEVMDFGITEDNRPYFVMEYLVGESLADRLDRHVRLNEAMAVEILDQILGGLASAHRAGVVHRDLKPDNIWLVKNDDKTETAKILDFGISKLVAGSPSYTPPAATDANQQLTQRGIVLGTPGYMAPETIFGLADVDGRADLFSLAVILYEMVTGKRPFRGENVRAVMVATATADPERPSKHRGELSSAMDLLIMTGLAKEAEDRFQTAEEFLTNLSAAAVGRTPTGSPAQKTKLGIPSIVPTVYTTPETTELTAERPPLAPDDVPELAIDLESRREERGLSSVTALSPYERRRTLPNRESFAVRAKRFYVGLPIIPMLMLAFIGGAFYYYFFEQEAVLREPNMDPIDQRIRTASQNYGTEREETKSEPISNLAGVVTIWIDSRPRDVQVSWNGVLLVERPLIVPVGDKLVDVTFSAKGYKESIRQIIPNKELTIAVRLKKVGAKKKRKKRKR
jgi:serine/threonine protein kinase